MLNDPVLFNDWHVVAYAPDLVEGKPNCTCAQNDRDYDRRNRT